MAMFKTVEPPELTLAVAEGNLQKVKELIEKGKLVTEVLLQVEQRPSPRVEEEADYDDCLVLDSDGAGDASSTRQRRVPVDVNGKVFSVNKQYNF